MEEKKYVDFDEVITTYKTFGHLNLHNALEAFNEIPAADVRPVVRGKWILKDNGEVVCSECNGLIAVVGNTEDLVTVLSSFNFCPNCCASMKETINE